MHRPLRAVALAALLVVVVAPRPGHLVPPAAAAQVDDAAARDVPIVSPALFAQADALAVQVATAAAEVDRTGAALREAQADRADAGARLQEARAGERLATDALAGLAVAAYTSGGVIPDELILEMLTSEGFSVDHETKVLLIQTVADTLVLRRSDSVGSLASATDGLAAAEALAAERSGAHDAAVAAHDQLAAREASTRQAAEQALAAEEAEAERRAVEAFLAAAAEAELRANTPVPESYRSGVVPPFQVPAVLTARLGGEIPRTALNAYWRASGTAVAVQPGCGVDWALLAAIGKVETNHGRFRGTVVAADGSTSPVILGPPLDGGGGFLEIRDTDAGQLDGDPIVDRAVGPMQFIPGTWRAYAADGNGDGVADPHNQYDASVAAGRYLCRSGGGWGGDTGSTARAVRAYNRSSAYVAEVLSLAQRYRVIADPSAAATTTTLPDLPDDDDDVVRPPLDDGSTTTTAPTPPPTGDTTTTTSPASTTTTTSTTTSSTAPPPP